MSCECDREKIDSFLEEIERFKEKEKEEYEVCKVFLEPIYKDYNKKYSAWADGKISTEEIREATKKKRADISRVLTENNLTLPPVCGRFYPNGSRYCDSFGFRVQMPGECEECYERYCDGANEALKDWV